MNKKVLCIMIIMIILMGMIIFFSTTNTNNEREVNALGGSGTVSTCSSGQMIMLPVFYDERNYYYDTYDNGKHIMVARDILDGSIRNICEKTMCNHRDEDCLANVFYKNGITINYYICDGKVLYYTLNDNKLNLYEWDIINNTKQKKCEFPAKIQIVDPLNDENVIEATSTINMIDRGNENTILVYLGFSLYILDNDYNEKDIIECGSGCGFVYDDEFVYIVNGKNSIKYSMINNTKTEVSLFPENSFISSGFFYNFNDRIIYAVDDNICSYDKKSCAIQELSKYDIHSFFYLDNKVLFYYENNKINRLDLMTGVIEGTDMSYMPMGRINNNYVVYDDDTESYNLYLIKE